MQEEFGYGRQGGVEGSGESTFLSTHPREGLVDIAVPGVLVGLPTLRPLEGLLEQKRLRVIWLPKLAQAQEVGGKAKMAGVVRIPIGIGGTKGLVEAT
eukprot:10250031-Lingulodinium_polyedra.AAC.1